MGKILRRGYRFGMSALVLFSKNNNNVYEI